MTKKPDSVIKRVLSYLGDALCVAAPRIDLSTWSEGTDPRPEAVGRRWVELHQRFMEFNQRGVAQSVRVGNHVLSSIEEELARENTPALRVRHPHSLSSDR